VQAAGRHGRDHHHDHELAASLENGKVREIEIAPEEIGRERAAMAELKAGDPAHNAEAIHKVLRAEECFRDIVVLNSAAALMVAGRPRT